MKFSWDLASSNFEDLPTTRKNKTVCFNVKGVTGVGTENIGGNNGRAINEIVSSMILTKIILQKYHRERFRSLKQNIHPIY